MKIQVLMLKQDDPKKCTAAKLVKFGLAKSVQSTSGKTLVLDPFSEIFLLPSDKKLVNSIMAVDCSWNQAITTFTRKFAGITRKLPPLFAGNPVNYSKLGKLTSAEALAGAAYILGDRVLATSLLDKFKWGHTFFDLNNNLLEDYLKLENADEIDSLLKEYKISAQ